MANKEQPKVTVWQKIALVTCSTALALALVLVLGNLVKYGDGTLTKAIVLKSWQAKNNIFGEAEIGIFKADPVFGWKLRPRSVGRHFQPYGFNVRYQIDEEGHRETPGSYDLPKVLFLGCSFSVGHGVEDDENFIWRLGENFPNYKMVNGSAMAWGTTQAWLQMQEEFNRFDNIQLVVYGFITFQKNRNYLRRGWLDLVESWGRKNPYFDIENGQLVYKGLANAKESGIEPGHLLEEKELQVTLRLIQEMRDFCAQRSVPFMVVHIPDSDTANLSELRSVLDTAQYLDLRKVLSYESIRLAGDSHPSPEGHRQLADQLAPAISKILLDSPSISLEKTKPAF